MSRQRTNLIRLGSVVVVIALWAFFARIVGEDFLPGPVADAASNGARFL